MNERTRSVVESVLVCTIMIGGIIWVLCHEKLYISDYTHWQFPLNRLPSYLPSYYHCFLFIGIPLLIGIIFYSSSKMVRFILRHRMNKMGNGKKI